MERTGITPTAEDFDYIHAVYLNTSMNKDEFCKDFKKHGDSRIIRDVHVRVLNYEMKCERQKEVIDNLTDFLIGKAHACKEFKAMNDPTSGGIRQSLQEIGIRLGVLEDTNATLKESMRQRNSDLTDFLIGKAHAYDDTDFRKEAVRLAGEVEVVKRTIELGLPLWDEDRKVVLSMIEEQGK